MVDMHLEQVHGHRRHQGPREHVGSEHGEDHCFRERNEQEPRDAAEEEHRHEDDTDAKRGDQGRDRNLRRALKDRMAKRLAFFEKTLDVFDGDGGIVHQDSDRQRQATERHGVDGFARAG